MTAAAILSEAARIVDGPRRADYGPPAENFARIATGWTVIARTEITPEMVARMMAWLKIARLVEGPSHDSYVDGAAYMALAGELATTGRVPGVEGGGDDAA